MRPTRPALLAVSALLSLLAVAACTSASAGWTYTPAPPPTPAPSVEPSSVAPSGSAGASAAPSGGASAGPSAPAGAALVTIAAAGVQFTTPSVSVAADTAFTLEFDNQDPAIVHDVQIKDGAGTAVFQTDTFPGPEKRSYQVPALAAGSYPFVCTVHVNMTGTLTAQ